MSKFKEMKQQDIKILKEKIWLENNKMCPILDTEIPLDKMVLDHIHKLKNDSYSEDKGTIRTSLEFRVNAFFGKMENAFKRYGLDKEHNLAEILRKAADYFDKGAYQDEEGFYYIHPTEVKKEPKMSKKNYNKLKKEYMLSGKKVKFPEFPKSGKVTVGFKALFEEFKISPYN